MSKKVKIIISVVAVLAVIAAGFGIYTFVKHQQQLAAEAKAAEELYHATYLILDGVEYRRDIQELDLSETGLVEKEKLPELKELKKLNLRDTGITPEEYAEIQALVPDCEVLWSVPFQGGYLDNTIEELTVETLTAEDFAALEHFLNLTHIHADGCRDYDTIMALMEQRPDLAYTYIVELCGQDCPNSAETLDFSDPDIDDLMAKLCYMPALKTVNLSGKLPTNETLLTLKDAYPEITFVWPFEVMGIPVTTVTDFIDISGTQLKNTDELESMLPYFYNLEKVDMIGCGLTNEYMAELNARHPETNFVWKVAVSGVMIRTDAKYFMPIKYKMKNVGDLYNLRYCTEMVAMDFGHYGVRDSSYLEFMPNLKYLLYFECSVTDLSNVGKCTSLVYFETACSNVPDLWPLTNLTNLQDLNISYAPLVDIVEGELLLSEFSDLTPLYQMTWLDRLWMASCVLTKDQRASLQEALPNTTLLFVSDGSTNRGWRQSPNYYEQRDVLEMWYMVH